MAYQGRIKQLLLALIIFAYAAICAASSQNPFHLYKLTGSEPGPTILIIGGIQGDEPGGFTAATLVAMNYKITKGNVWVVPNLNFKSIINSSRGLYGDMNRKFLHIGREDPDYQIVSAIKKLIVDKNVDLILNLHDGSGFYNPEYIDREHNPYRWGQSVIIDQEKIGQGKYADLYRISSRATEAANKHLAQLNQYHVKNTRTREGDKEMEKSLTYFAITNGKAAFGIEASKSFPTRTRAYFHLRVIESFMDILEIKYERDFDLHEDAISKVMYQTIDVSLYKNKFYLPGDNLKKQIYYVPMRKGGSVEYSSRNPLVAVMESGTSYKVKFGNRNISYLYPQYFEFDDSLDSVEISIDGKKRWVTIGSVVDVNRSFNISKLAGVRVNVIGARLSAQGTEAGFNVTKAMMPEKYSVDNAGKMYRVEFYRGKKYSGMILVRFTQ